MKFKNHFFALILMCLPLFIQSQTSPAQDSTGLPGDNFSLEGAVELFKKAKSPEDFEKLLNKEENYVNNLDLDGDGEIDYIRVVDNKDGDVHAIVLQIAVSESESQDVAVIEIEKQGEEEAILQILGDEVLYGEETIIEPYEMEADDDGRGPAVTVDRIVVNVFFWPSVRFIYHPGYVVYVSPWRYRHYPGWWRPWRPHSWRRHHSHRAVYRSHYRVAPTHRVVRAHRVYTPHRRTSKVVRTRTTTTRVASKGNKKVGVQRTTTTKTTRGKNGAVTQKKKTTTTVGAKGKKGKAGAKKSTTRTTKKGANGRSTTKKTTRAAGKRGRNGGAVGKKRTTTVKRKRKG